MLQIIGDSLHQWEKGRKVKIECEESFTEVHFSHLVDSEALIVAAVGDTAEIPNILLQRNGHIRAFLVRKEGDIEHTLCSNTFSVRKRPKPADYVYTETEVKNYDVLLKRIEALEESGSDISITVDDALSEESENPVQNKVVTSKFSQLSQENVEQGERLVAVEDILFTNDGEEEKELSFDYNYYWKKTDGKAVKASGSGLYAYYIDVSEGEKYKITFMSHQWTASWLLVDNELNIISEPTNSYSDYGSTIYEETLTIPSGATQLLITGGAQSLYKPTCHLLGGKAPKDFVEKSDIAPIPKIVTVKQDGTGDYTTIRSAVDSISDSNSETNPYIIELYEGTYNVFDDYTDEEILSAGTEHYTDTSFVGIKLTDGISLKGIGFKENIIINGEVSTDYDSDLRNNLSTLNMQGSNSLENVTVTAKNIRYAVHDDFTNSDGAKRFVKDCIFKGVSLTSGTKEVSYGMGQRPNDFAHFENCDFSTTFGWHSANLASAVHHSELTLTNCKAITCALHNYNHSVINRVHLNCCDFPEITFTESSDTHMCTLDGVNTKDYMLSCPTGFIYDLGNVVRFNRTDSTSYTIGQMVKLHSSLYWEGAVSQTNNKDIAYGVIVGVTDSYYYVQTDGYINSNTLNLTGLVVGDYVTVDSNGLVVTGGTSDNAIGVVKRLDKEGIAIIKILI